MSAPAAALVAAVGMLAVHNLGVERLPPRLYVPACLATVSALVGFARAAGIEGEEIGLSAAGLGWGLVVAGAAVSAVAAAAALPRARPLFADRRIAGVGRAGVAYRALVRIPLGTVALEEIAFRGVLPALLSRLVPLGWAIGASCVLFGLWHVVPVRSTLRTNGRAARPGVITAAVVAAGIGGGALAGLRLSTDGLVAPAMAHASITATATVVAARVVKEL